jgi:DNA-binding NarL/FixJ family response regulator
MISSNPRRITVWLIEDNASYRHSVLRAFDRMEGLRCTSSFPSFEDALPRLHDPTLPDVILLDVGLPGLDGISAIARIRALHPGAKILILTVFDAPQKIFAAICAGAAGYLLKTASIAEVAEAIRQAVDGGAPMTPRVAKLVLERFSSMAAHALRSPDYSLTDREREVLEFMVQGLIKKEIAARLHVSVHTVATHIRHVYEKLQVTTNTAAVSKALREGLVSSRP